jgi:hypothetical protein
MPKSIEAKPVENKPKPVISKPGYDIQGYWRGSSMAPRAYNPTGIDFITWYDSRLD